jgi:hypothetical protein
MRVIHLSTKPDMGDHAGAIHIHQGQRIAGIHRNAGIEFIAILTAGTAIAGAGGVLAGIHKGFTILGNSVHNNSSSV